MTSVEPTILHIYQLQYRKPVSCNSEEVGAVPPRSVPLNARDYVESLHQNNKATLLYGKNNVHVQPVSTDVIPETCILPLLFVILTLPPAPLYIAYPRLTKQ